jgi:hypothetical protein
VQIRICGQHFGQSLSHFALQESQNAPNLLQRKAFAPKFGYYGDFYYLFGKVNAFVAFVMWGNYLTFIPPL